jgi:16S rRNA (uracil1498-N3)-methyltransferase
MRKKVGDIIHLFNGKDGEWAYEITELHKRETILTLQSQVKSQPASNDLWLLFSPLKPKRQEFLIEKATELGVSCLWPILCERTSIPRVNLEKMQAHVIEVAEQCGRLSITEIKPMTQLSKALTGWPLSHSLIFGDETLTAPSIANIAIKKPCAFFVGPEGGFTEQEFNLLKRKGRGVTLNQNILRAETAALAGLACISLKVCPIKD